jgi:hypothetical protein
MFQQSGKFNDASKFSVIGSEAATQAVWKVNPALHTLKSPPPQSDCT